jgi:general secretion pathway protein A
MYERFFSLARLPFSLVPDPDCIHLTTQHAGVINGLAFGVLGRRGYLVLTGEPGLGKTTSLRALAHLLHESNVELSVVLSPTLTPSEFLESVMLNFGFKNIPASKAQRLRLLEDFLLQSDAAGKVLALIVDEAHQLSEEVLEEVRLLGNFEGANCKLLQIVLVGQNELNDLLNLPQSWPLKQRITIRLSLRRLDRDAVEEYVRLQWRQAGGPEAIPFSKAAIDTLAVWSNGVPRLINVICDNALLIAFSETSQVVDIHAVREACEELALPTPVLEQQSPSSPEVISLAQAVDHSPFDSSEPAELETAPGAWVASEPSLLKRWLQRGDSRQPRPVRSKSGTLSLNQP